jgi:hypothetical protein
MKWHWNEERTKLYEDDREVLSLGCVEEECHCSGDPPSEKDAELIAFALEEKDE